MESFDIITTLANFEDYGMNIKGFVWLDDIVEKIQWKHGVFQVEVEEVFRNVPKFKFGKRGSYNGENLYYCFGRTDAGRYLFIVFIYKKSKEALILSARDMTRSERRTYEKM